MKPVYSETKTDSLTACVASILEIDLSEIPDFFSEIFSLDDPFQELKDFLESMGWLLLQTTAQPDTLGIAIMSFGEANHQYAVVWQNGCVHDPRPEDSPQGRLISFFVLAPIDITDYVRTIHSQSSDHAYWSQIRPGTPYFVWYADDVFRKVFRFYANGRAWFSDTIHCTKADSFYHATPAVSVI